MQKQYVRVTTDMDATGYMQPRSITWNNGREFHIDSIRDFRPSELLGKPQGYCYTVVISGKEKMLYFEYVDAVFRGRIGRWYVEVTK